jgi:hypothetical protein
MKSIGILQDARIEAFPTFGPKDVAEILAASKWSARFVDLPGLKQLDRSEMDVLILPYLKGELDPEGLAALLRFHGQGGSLLFLGDTPHRAAWYPYRNSQAPQLRLTRATDSLVLQGLTDKGREIFGEFPELAPFLGQRMSGIRTSAYPPDVCHGLLKGGGHYKDVSPIVFIERKCREFFGAKLAVVGFDGGEPRENVLGVCSLPYVFEPGLLHRSWPGCRHLLLSLVSALVPDPLAASIEFQPVAAAGSSVQMTACVRNLQDHPLENVAVQLEVEGFEKPLGEGAWDRISPGETVSLGAVSNRVAAGPSEVKISVRSKDGVNALATRMQFGFVENPGRDDGFGFSTYRAFGPGGVDAAFKSFVREMGRLGMQYVRYAVSWEDAEPRPGAYDWTIPDQLLELAAENGLKAFFWVFPTARGSGLGDAGIPAWVLKEPAIDRHGKPGNFPCIWSPYYRERYLGFLEALTQRYAEDVRLSRFVFDFGNSDFAYSYHYYGEPGDEFDYSPHEQRAFSDYLERQTKMPLAEISKLWGTPFISYADVTIPFAESTRAWLIYDEFRRWGVHHGVKAASQIVSRHAPKKAPLDPPGHGLGSIADLTTYTYNVLARNWENIREEDRAAADVHNAGPVWGGEPWQVGGRFADCDEALFQSVRLGAGYFTIPGPDLGAWEADIGRAAMLRRSLMGSSRLHPEIAIMDRMGWDASRSLAQVGARLDQPVDLLSPACRFDLSAYRLLVLPGHELFSSGDGVRSLLPSDRRYYERLRESVLNGLTVLLFPRTGTSPQARALREILGLEDVHYGERRPVCVALPDSFGGGALAGCAQAVHAKGGETLLADNSGLSLLVRRPLGRGAILLAGYDNAADSLDGAFSYAHVPHLRDHTLVRLLQHLDIQPRGVETGQACLYKEMVRQGRQDWLLLYSHQEEPLEIDLRCACRSHSAKAMDLATGESYPMIETDREGWRGLHLTVCPQRGYYLFLGDGGKEL